MAYCPSLDKGRIGLARRFQQQSSMVGYRMPSGGGFIESVDDFMARRRREVDRQNRAAEAAGYAAWR